MKIHHKLSIAIILMALFAHNISAKDKGSLETIDLSTIKNEGAYELALIYSKKNAVKIKLYENNYLKIVTMGNVNLPNHNNLLKLTHKAMNKLDLWTGSQKIFNKKLPADAKYEIVLFESKAHFLKFNSFFSKERNYRDSGFASQLLIFGTYKTTIMVHTKKRQKIIDFIFAGTVTQNALHKFEYFHESKVKAGFFSEGLSSNMQYELCGKKVRYYTISYEMNRWKGGYNKSWSNSVKATIKKKDNSTLRDGYFLMEIDLVKNSLQDYQQLWSLCRYLIKRAKNKKGPTNKLFQLLVKKANKVPVQKMVKDVFKSKVATLTKNWYRWAYRQKR